MKDENATVRDPLMNNNEVMAVQVGNQEAE